MSSKKTPESFARDAENQIADQLAMRVSRFRKAKKNRKVLAADVVKWAGELLKLVSALSVETALPSPVPPLASPQERKEQAGFHMPQPRPVDVTKPAKTVELMLVDLRRISRDDHSSHEYLRQLTDYELSLLSVCPDALAYYSAIDLVRQNRGIQLLDSIKS